MKASSNFYPYSAPTTVEELVRRNRSIRQKLLDRTTSILSYFLQMIAGNSEPRVWQKRDRNGELLWYVYDPETDQTTRFVEESEVRSWLEQRYHH